VQTELCSVEEEIIRLGLVRREAERQASGAAAELGALHSVLATVQSNITNESNELLQLQNAAYRFQQRNRSIYDQVSHSERRHSDLAALLGEAAESNRSLSARLRESLSEHSSLESALSESSLTFSALKGELHEKEQQLLSLRRRVESDLRSGDAAQDSVERSTNEQQSISAQLHTQAKDLFSALSEMEEIESIHASLVSDIESAEHRRGSIEGESISSKEELSLLEIELSNHRSLLNSLSQEIEERSSLFEFLTHEIERQQSLLNAVSEEISASHQTRQNLLQTIDDNRKMLEQISDCPL
jgi:chromosome segregation ATPase